MGFPCAQSYFVGFGACPVISQIFLQLLCHLSQGCNKVVWGAVGAAVVITLITIMAVYVSSKLKLRVCTRATVCLCFQSERSA